MDMKFARFLLSVALAGSLAGCAPVDSMNPLYTEHGVVFDPELLGQWSSEDGGLNFARLADDGYSLFLSGKDSDTGQVVTARFEGHLVDLQGHRFLDVTWKNVDAGDLSRNIPEVHLTRNNDGEVEVEPRLTLVAPGIYWEFAPGESGDGGAHFTVRPREAHEFFKVVLEDEGRTLELLQLDESWVRLQIEEGKLEIGHEKLQGGDVVLTASTHDLQQLLLDHVNDQDAFTGAMTLKRVDQTLCRW
jgi:hypothetical protein